MHEVTRVRYKLAIAGTAILLVEKHHTKAYVYLWFIYVLICLVTILPVLFLPLHLVVFVLVTFPPELCSVQLKKDSAPGAL